MRAEETAFWKFSSGKLFLNSQNTLKKMTTMESDLSKVAPACLLKSLSVMGNFLVKFFKGLLKTVYSTRNTTLGLFLKFISDVHSSVAGVWLFSSYDCNKSSASQKVSETNCLSPGGSFHVPKSNSFISLFISISFILQIIDHLVHIHHNLFSSYCIVLQPHRLFHF